MPESICPACGVAVPGEASECPGCHLSVGLFGAVREAAGAAPVTDPTYLRTIGELLATVDLSQPAAPAAEPARGLLSRPPRFPALRVGDPGPSVIPESDRLSPLRNLPALPAPPTVVELKRRVDEYFAVGRRLGLNFTDFEARANGARLVDDVPSLEVLSREMFVHLSSALAEEYESALARRNELAQLVPTGSADVELTTVRRAIATGDLPGAQRRLAHVRDELGRLEEEWQVGRILVTECDLLAATARDLGADPTPALGPVEEGRRLIARGRRADGEAILARAAVALWAILEPRFLEDLHRVRDRLADVRGAGLDVRPALEELRSVAAELRQRNFAGAIVAYRRLRAFADRYQIPGEESSGVPAAPASMRPAPSA
ncbi:MAG TPA: hypothetical protein VMG81_04855 [Thermoplasmata archaeon]|nr:hypothetical protein [Thermoplasmata archaeon]